MSMETEAGGLKSQEAKIPLIERLAPYPYALGEYAKRRIKGHDETIDKIGMEITDQADATFNPAVESREFPGVRTSMIVLEFTQDFVRSFNKHQVAQPEVEALPGQERKPKIYVYVCQPAFGAGTVGNAYSMLDVAENRLIRGAQKVLAGDKVIFIADGAPVSNPGAVTPDWVKGVAKDGFDMHGRLYAEHTEKYLQDNFGDNLENVVVTVEAQSRGSNTAARTVHFLSEKFNGDEYKDKPKPTIRGLYEAPTGNHDSNLRSQFIHSVNMLDGLIAETAARMLKTKEVLADMAKTEALFMQRLFKRKGIKPDSTKQTMLKNAALLTEALALGKGTPINKDLGRGKGRDKDEDGNKLPREYSTEPGFDPTNVPKDFLKNLRTDGLGLRLKSRRPFLRIEGRRLIARTRNIGHYYFPLPNDLHRWEQIFQKIEGGENPIVRR